MSKLLTVLQNKTVSRQLARSLFKYFWCCAQTSRETVRSERHSLRTFRLCVLNIYMPFLAVRIELMFYMLYNKRRLSDGPSVTAHYSSVF